METRICKLDGCSGNHYGLGYCRKHYKRSKKGDDLFRVESKRSIADPRYFWAKAHLTADGGRCWEWQSTLTESGYGLASVVLDGINYQRAHRVAFYFANGFHPHELFVLHKCDNRRCVNPNHLFLGDHDTNMADMTTKRRQAVGERSGRHKLTEKSVRSIIACLNQGQTGVSIANQFTTSESTVSQIKRGNYWKNILREVQV